MTNAAVLSRRRTPERRLADESFGDRRQKQALRLWGEVIGGNSGKVRPTTQRYAAVDGIAVTDDGLIGVYFIEVVSRRDPSDKYSDYMLDRPQYGRIVQLYKLTGFPTAIIYIFTDAAGYTILPSSKVREEGEFVYVDPKDINWISSDDFATYFSD